MLKKFFINKICFLFEYFKYWICFSVYFIIFGNLPSVFSFGLKYNLVQLLIIQFLVYFNFHDFVFGFIVENFKMF